MSFQEIIFSFFLILFPLSCTLSNENYSSLDFTQGMTVINEENRYIGTIYQHSGKGLRASHLAMTSDLPFDDVNDYFKLVDNEDESTVGLLLIKKFPLPFLANSQRIKIKFSFIENKTDRPELNFIELSFFIRNLFKNETAYDHETIFKDVFIDGSRGLSQFGRDKMPVWDLLGLSSYDFLLQDPQSINKGILGNEHHSGNLFYPDGTLRYHLFVSNGGKASLHRKFLNRESAKNIRNFYYSGGSYLGFCAGAFLSGGSIDNDHTEQDYSGYNIFNIETDYPGFDSIIKDYINTKWTNIIFEDTHIPISNNIKLYYSGGPSISQNNDPNLIPLFSYINVPREIGGWAKKDSLFTGRAIAIGVHPERKKSEEEILLMKGLVHYAFNGLGKKIREEKIISKNKPFNSELLGKNGSLSGGQIHHFKINQGDEILSLQIHIKKKGEIIQVFLKKNESAYEGNADHRYLFHDSSIEIRLPSLDIEKNQWHFSIKRVISANKYRSLDDLSDSELEGIHYEIFNNDK